MSFQMIISRLGVLPFLMAFSACFGGKPNFLVIVVDDMGYADVSAYEHRAKDAHTPNIDKLANRGILYTNAYVSAPVCSPSRAGWVTGQHQVRWDPKSGFNCGLPKGTPTLASILKSNGYATARFGKNDFGNKSIHKQGVYAYPLNHGFEEFLGFSAHGHDFFLLSEEIEKRTPDPKGHSAVVGPLQHNRGRKEFKDGYLTDIFTHAAIDFMKRPREKPFFVTLSYNSVHHLIHQSPKRYLDKFGVKEIPNYDPHTDGKYADWFKQFITLGRITADEMRRYYLANLNCLDDNIGRLLHALEEHQLAENTHIVFFSDNGGAPTNGAWNLPLSGAKFSLWEGGIRVPFILSRPGDPHAGEIWDDTVSSLDIVPTILDIADIPLPERLDGQIIPKCRSGFEETRNLFWRFNNSYAVRSGDWKLLHNGTVSGRKPTHGIINRPGLTKGTRLFNLKADPGESRDLSKKHPKVLQRLRSLYTEWSKEGSSGSIRN